MQKDKQIQEQIANVKQSKLQEIVQQKSIEQNAKKVNQNQDNLSENTSNIDSPKANISPKDDQKSQAQYLSCIKDLNQIVKSSEKEIQQLRKQNSDMEKKNNNLQDQNTKLQQTIEQLQNQLTLAQKEFASQAQKQVQDQKNEDSLQMSILNQEILKSKEKVRNLSQELELSKQQAEQLQQSSNQQNVDIQAQNNQISTFKSQISIKEQLVDTLNQKIDFLQTKLQSFEDDNIKLRKQLEKQSNQTTFHSSLQQENSLLKTQVDKLESFIQEKQLSLKQNIECDKCKQCEKQLQQLKQELNKYISSGQGNSQQDKSLLLQINELQLTNDQLFETIKITEQTNQNLLQQVSNMEKKLRKNTTDNVMSQSIQNKRVQELKQFVGKQLLQIMQKFSQIYVDVKSIRQNANDGNKKISLQLQCNVDVKNIINAAIINQMKLTESKERDKNEQLTQLMKSQLTPKKNGLQIIDQEQERQQHHQDEAHDQQNYINFQQQAFENMIEDRKQEKDIKLREVEQKQHDSSLQNNVENRDFVQNEQNNENIVNLEQSNDPKIHNKINIENEQQNGNSHQEIQLNINELNQNELKIEQNTDNADQQKFQTQNPDKQNTDNDLQHANIKVEYFKDDGNNYVPLQLNFNTDDNQNQPNLELMQNLNQQQNLDIQQEQLYKQSDSYKLSNQIELNRSIDLNNQQQPSLIDNNYLQDKIIEQNLNQQEQNQFNQGGK